MGIAIALLKFIASFILDESVFKPAMSEIINAVIMMSLQILIKHYLQWKKAYRVFDILISVAHLLMVAVAIQRIQISSLYLSVIPDGGNPPGRTNLRLGLFPGAKVCDYRVHASGLPPEVDAQDLLLRTLNGLLLYCPERLPEL